jgi:hypothetical protein
MNSAHDLLVHSPDRAASPPHSTPNPLASWYTPGLSDALGDRLLMFDNTDAASLELLRFRPELASFPGFERALRGRVAQLSRFAHPSFARVRAVERLEGDEGLALVSVHTAGKRLSELFHGADRRGGFHPAFAAWVIRELTPALAELHARGEGVAHGALAADRVVLTPDRRLVIVEHALGSALAALELSPHRLWRDLNVIAPRAGGAAAFTSRQDVTQLGLLALSFVLGRRVTPDEYPQRLPRLLDEFSDRAGRRSPKLVAQLRPWLERALDTQDAGFMSAMDAANALHLLRGSGDRPARQAMASPRRRAIGSLAETRMNQPASDPFDTESAPDQTVVDPDESSAGVVIDYPSEPWSAERVERAADALAAIQASRRAPRRIPIATILAVGFALLAIAEAAVIARFLRNGSIGAAGAVATAPITIESPTSGDAVVVNGRQVGVTPLQLPIDPSTRSIRIVSGTPQTTSAPGTPEATSGVVKTAALADARAANEAEAARAIAAAASRQRSGGVKFASPIELNVFDGDKILGSTANGPIVSTAGVHQLDLVNNALGFRARQTVDVKAGQIVTVTIQPPEGRVSINALPWAQVWIDGNAVGETPLANLSVPLGEHEITFRHPQLGERKVTTLVKAGAPTRVSATFSQ